MEVELDFDSAVIISGRSVVELWATVVGEAVVDTLWEAEGVMEAEVEVVVEVEDVIAEEEKEEEPVVVEEVVHVLLIVVEVVQAVVDEVVGTWRISSA